uniref:Uncharacterized protein n=1 Tax=Knipowitschia caucasica TaxID=637954 RepID=A0AAV2LTG0_KNICA
MLGPRRGPLRTVATSARGALVFLPAGLIGGAQSIGKLRTRGDTLPITVPRNGPYTADTPSNTGFITGSNGSSKNSSSDNVAVGVPLLNSGSSGSSKNSSSDNVAVVPLLNSVLVGKLQKDEHRNSQDSAIGSNGSSKNSSSDNVGGVEVPLLNSGSSGSSKNSSSDNVAVGVPLLNSGSSGSSKNSSSDNVAVVPLLNSVLVGKLQKDEHRNSQDSAIGSNGSSKNSSSDNVGGVEVPLLNSVPVEHPSVNKHPVNASPDGSSEKLQKDEDQNSQDSALGSNGSSKNSSSDNVTVEVPLLNSDEER